MLWLCLLSCSYVITFIRLGMVLSVNGLPKAAPEYWSSYNIEITERCLEEENSCLRRRCVVLCCAVLCCVNIYNVYYVLHE